MFILLKDNISPDELDDSLLQSFVREFNSLYGDINMDLCTHLVTSATPAPPITTQIPGLGSIICAEFVLSSAPSPRICAATQPEIFQIEFGWCGRHASTTHNSTNSRTCSNNSQFDKKKVIFCPHVLMVIFPFLGGKNDGK